MQPRLIHVWSDTLGDDLPPETRRRNIMARSTWEAERKRGEWVNARFSEKAAEIAGRTSRKIGDVRDCPFVRDMIYFGARTLGRDFPDIIVITNADICFLPGITEKIVAVVGEKGSAFACRFDFPVLTVPWQTEAQLCVGKQSAGCDLFAFTIGWWYENGADFPDMVLGREKWDLVMRNLVKITGGGEIPKCIYHESHLPFWAASENRRVNAANLHNARLSDKFFIDYKARGADPKDWVEKAYTVAVAEMERAQPRKRRSAFFGNTCQLTPAIRR